MRIIKVIFPLLLLIVILSGCGNQITSGKVYKKRYVPAHEETNTTPIVISTGKTITTVLIPRTERIPDKWYITIRSETPNEDGKFEESMYSVSEETFNRYEVGDFYSHGK